MEQTEIVVAGAGVIGASIARQLRLSGRRVVLIDRGAVAGEASGAAAGILGVFSETGDDTLTRLGMRSASAYPGLIGELLEATGIAVEYSRTGTLFLAPTAAEGERLAQRRRRCARLGAVIDQVSADQLCRLEPHLSRRAAGVGALLFHGEGRVDSAALARACTAEFAARGGRFRQGCRLDAVVVQTGRVTGVVTDDGEIGCDVVVDARGAWSASGVPGVRVEVEPVRGQMVCVRGPRRVFGHTIYRENVYASPRRDGRVLLGSTREPVGFENAVTATGAGSILRRAFEIAGDLQRLPVDGWWSGLRLASPDGLPIVGFAPEVEGYMLATGHGPNGILLAPVTAAIVSELLDGVARAEDEALSPARPTLHAPR